MNDKHDWFIKLKQQQAPESLKQKDDVYNIQRKQFFKKKNNNKIHVVSRHSQLKSNEIERKENDISSI